MYKQRLLQCLASVLSDVELRAHSFGRMVRNNSFYPQNGRRFILNRLLWVFFNSVFVNLASVYHRTNYINCIFLLFCILDDLAFEGLTDTRKDCPSQGQLIPKDKNKLPKSKSIICKTLNPESIVPTIPLSNLHTSSQYFPHPKSSQGQVQATRTTPTAPILLELIQTNQPKTLFPALPCPAFPTKTSVKALVLTVSCLVFCYQIKTWCFLCDTGVQ